MKSLIMNAEMIRAYAEGRKDVTRRLMEPQPKFSERPFQVSGDMSGNWYQSNPDYPRRSPMMSHTWKPPFRPGEQIYIRETWHCDDPAAAQDAMSPGYGLYYKATEICPQIFNWTPSIHMPEWAARFRPTVISIRPERIQSITEEDAKREGMNPNVYDDGFTGEGDPIPRPTYVEPFMELWNSLYGQWNGIYKRVNGKRTLVGFECYPLSEWDIPPIPAKARKLGLPCTAHPNPWIWRIELTKVTQ